GDADVVRLARLDRVHQTRLVPAGLVVAGDLVGLGARAPGVERDDRVICARAEVKQERAALAGGDAVPDVRGGGAEIAVGGAVDVRADGRARVGAGADERGVRAQVAGLLRERGGRAGGGDGRGGDGGEAERFTARHHWAASFMDGPGWSAARVG